MNRIAQAPPSTTPDSTQADEALRRVTASQAARRLPEDWYTTAARALHNTHCADCRALSDEMDRNAAENSASMARRDRRQLGLPFSRHTRQVNV